MTLEHFPLQQNDRPGWGAPELLEKLHWHASAALPGWGLPARVGFGANWTLKACAQALRDFPDLDAAGMINSWKGLPLLFPKQWVRHWEENRPWLGLGLHPTQTQAYQALLDGSQPSLAYCPAQNAAAQAVWKLWLGRADLSSKTDLFLHSAQAWQQWARRHPHADQARQIRDAVVVVGERIGLDQEQADLWACLEMWWAQMSQTMPEIANSLVHLSWGAEGWLAMCSAAMEATPVQLRALFEHLEQLGFYRSLSEDSAEQDKTFEGFMGKWRQPFWHQAISGFRMRGCLAWDACLQQLPPVKTAAPNRWSHMQTQYDSLVAALRRGPVRVLVRGQSVADVQAFCQQAIQQAGLLPFQLRVAENDTMDQLIGAHWACAMAQDRALLMSLSAVCADPKSQAKWGDLHRTRLLAVSDMSDIPKTTHELFEATIVLTEMPLSERFALAKEYFTDHKIALRAARTLHTGQQIVEAAQWCRQCDHWDWETVRAHHVGRSGPPQIQVAQDPNNKLPTLADNGRLTQLADHLALAVQQPENFELLGGQAPKGAILIGPPGTGKSLFARHLAHRLDVPLLAPDCAALFEKPENLVSVFEQARQCAPCVLLFDEADRLISPVSPILPALLSQLDGVDALEGVIVIAAGNADMIAASLVRPGRLSEVVRVCLPFEHDREKIWRAHLEGKPLEEMSLEEACQHLARATSGFSGADIAETLRRAATKVAIEGRAKFRIEDLIARIDEVRWSSPDGRDPMCEQERWRTCVHEAGHALLAWRWNMDVHRITVRSRAGALGSVQWGIPERQVALSRASAFGRLQMLLGGLAAETALFEDHGLGGGADLEAAHAWVISAVAQSGLGGLGPVAASGQILWSNALRERVESECHKWCQEAFDEAVAWLKAHPQMVDDLAQNLMTKFDVSGSDLDQHRKCAQSKDQSLPHPPQALRMPTSSALSFIHSDAAASTPQPASTSLHRQSTDPS